MAKKMQDVTVGKPARRILCLLRRRGAMSRAGIGRQLGIPASAVSGTCRQLMQAGVLARRGKERVESGRNVACIGFAEGFLPAAGVEVSRNGIRMAAIDAAGKILEQTLLSDRPVEREELVAAIQRTVNRVRRLGCKPRAIGVAAGGPVDVGGGIWIDHTHGNSSEGVTPGPALRKRLRVPLRLINDVHAACLAEARLGAGAGHRVVLYVHTGMGIRLALCVDGDIYVGAHGLAGELGHTRSSGQTLCYCGNHGCLETVASLPALAEKLSEAEKRSGTPNPAMGVDELFTLANGGHKAALTTLRRAAEEIGQAAADAAALFDPDVIVLGGRLTQGVEDFRKELAEVILDRLLPLMRRDIRVVQRALGDEVSAIGAAVLAQDTLMESMGMLPSDKTVSR